MGNFWTLGAIWQGWWGSCSFAKSFSVSFQRLNLLRNYYVIISVWFTENWSHEIVGFCNEKPVRMDLLNLFEFFAIGSNNFLQDRDLDVNRKIVDIIHLVKINLFWHFLKKNVLVGYISTSVTVTPVKSLASWIKVVSSYFENNLLSTKKIERSFASKTSRTIVINIFI